MTSDYIKQLRKGLKLLPAERRREIIADIESHFAEGIADGVSEQELCERLGAPEALAAEYTAGSEKRRTINGTIFRLLGVVSLNLFIMVWVWLAAVFAWLSVALFAVTGMVGGPLAAALAALKPIFPALPVYVDYPAIYIFGGLAVAALCVLLGMFAQWSGKWLIRGICAYYKFNVRLIVGRRDAE